ncbi:hypothetical protein [Mesorhizobium sp.]|uniref:hypothetical protein n=1 Tax=Mesorhizobium sp. TaxID=1871066 RepID=UPI0011FE17B5|nr:hypothetical protein [Mesorhizobium sp.]TIP43673.1 MAG: hypothetical protein E5X62_18205 [Mesorhizobium sp.]
MPNTPVRAAAEGMPAINRRRLLNLTGAGLALAATAASVRNASATPPVAAAAEHPDAELFRLEQEMEAAHARMETASESNSALSDKLEALLPPRPLHPTDWKSPEMPAHLKQQWDDGLKNVLFGDLAKRDWQSEPVRAWFDAIDRGKAQVQASWDEWSTLRDERYRERNFDALEEAFNACVSEVDEFTKRICSIPAHTFEGMAVKLRAHVRSGGEIEKEEMYLDDYALASIAADIRRLAGES